MLAVVKGRAKPQQARVHELSLEAGRPPIGAVGQVARDRVANRDEMHPQLVRAARQQERLDERPVAEPLEDRKTCLRASTTGANGHALSIAQVARNWRVDQPLVLA